MSSIASVSRSLASQEVRYRHSAPMDWLRHISMFRMILKQYSLSNAPSAEAVSSSSRNDFVRLSCRFLTCSCMLCLNRCSICMELHRGKHPKAHLSACVWRRNLLNLYIAGICPVASKDILSFLPVSSYSPAIVMNISRRAFEKLSIRLFSKLLRSYQVVASLSHLFPRN